MNRTTYDIELKPGENNAKEILRHTSDIYNEQDFWDVGDIMDKIFEYATESYALVEQI